MAAASALLPVAVRGGLPTARRPAVPCCLGHGLVPRTGARAPQQRTGLPRRSPPAAALAGADGPALADLAAGMVKIPGACVCYVTLLS
jgi:hypothetical protein